MPRHTWRHFKALMRKNLINWKRQPVCAFFEIASPLILMIVIAIIRKKIPYISVSPEGMLNYKLPIFPCCAKVDGKWKGTTATSYLINERVTNFLNYTDYNLHKNPPPLPNDTMSDMHDQFEDLMDIDQELYPHLANLKPSQVSGNVGWNPGDPYEVDFDWAGPQYFFPPQCVRQTSWSIPKRGSPIIAFIGDAANPDPISDDLANYFIALKKMQRATQAFLIVPAYRPQYFATKQELWDYIENPDYLQTPDTQGVCFGVEVLNDQDDDYKLNFFFNDQSFLASRFAYGIPSQAEPTYVPYKNAPDLPSYLKYRDRGYNNLQMLVANQILQSRTGDPDGWITVLYQPLPTETNISDPFGQILPSILPFFLLIAYIPPVYNTVFHLVQEKETRTKESMRMMGMTDTAYWLSWFVYYTMINTLISTLAWLILLYNVINFSEAGYIWLFFWLYGEAVFGQIVFLQSLFSSSKYSGIVSTLVYFGSDFFNFLITSDDTTRASKILASILPQVGLGQGSVVFAEYECTGVGIDRSTAAVLYLNYSFDTALWTFILSGVIFFTLGLYLDNTLPVKYGNRKSPIFCCLPKTYKCCRQERVRKVQTGEEYSMEEENDDFEMRNVGENNYEHPSLVAKRQEQFGEYLRIEGLKKTFGTGFQAVKGLNVKMYTNQIFALLGHNGAGKTTTISMLTGLIQRTEGAAKVLDHDVFEEMGDVREFMGVCPQHDVLFALLTPEEHLSIFYDFKGGDPAKKEEELCRMIKDVGLTIDREKCAHTLSGGNKRKLSVSIALCGGSKFVLLDEPTSGMDLGARRGLWDMLANYKKGRIVILTTHYMDEADVLGDRIGIMAKGQLMCLGSSLFLKNRFGAGYKLTLVKQEKELAEGMESFLDVYFNGIKKHSETRKEVNFVIPRDQTSNFKAFFQSFDSKLDEYKVKSYGVSMATLEDVFLKINKEFAPELFGFEGTEHSEDELKNSNMSDSKQKFKGIGHSMDTSAASQQTNLKDSNLPEDDGENQIRGSTICGTLGATTTKRFIMYRRDWCGIICEVIVPVIMVVIGLQFATQASKLVQSPDRFLSTGLLPNPQRVLMNKQNIISDADDITPQELFDKFPNSTSAFELSTIENGVGFSNYTDFYYQVYDQQYIQPLYPYRYGSFQIYQANKKNHTYAFTSFLNITSQDVAALYPQFMYQSILANAIDSPDLKFEVTTAPYPIFYAFKQREAAAQSFDFAFMVSIGLALIPCVMVSYILKEREEQLKHMQLISGMSLFGYWAANLMADIVKAYVPIGLILLLSQISGVWYPGTWVLFALFPWAVVPFSYTTSFLFSSDTVAQICTLFLHFLAGGVMSLTVFTLEVIPQTQQVGDILRWVFCVIPSFCVTHGIVWSASGEMLVKTRAESDGTGRPDLPDGLWDWFNLKGDAAALIAHFFIGIFIIVLIEADVFACFSKLSCRAVPEENTNIVLDEDVIAEVDRVAAQGAYNQSEVRATEQESLLQDSEARVGGKTDVIRIAGFRKAYSTLCGTPVLAVEKISFGLDYGECFALLGVNGAGKSTTFKSLTKDTVPTQGEITIAGYDVQKDFTAARKLIGYCPQYDALFPMITVEEHLWFYAKIKGVPLAKRFNMVERSIQELNLKDHRGKQSMTLSGGNKRKLAVAIALLGNPPVVLLDEPSAGMDPEARRFMWQVVENISQRDGKSAVILTTHSMEEAEALSTKMGIMVRGGIFRCFGSSQHIKNKYKAGYEIEAKIKKPQYEELQEMAEGYGLSKNLQSKINLYQTVAKCRNTNVDPLILDGVARKGLGADLILEAELDEHEEVKLLHFLTYIYVQERGFKLIEGLARLFEQVEILEHCSDFYKLRVPNEDKTIGFLFGTIEDRKGDYGVSEYSVSQTSLEQIFMNFANATAVDKAAFTFKMNALGALVCQNPDGRSTVSQTRLNLRGFNQKQQNHKTADFPDNQA